MHCSWVVLLTDFSGVVGLIAPLLSGLELNLKVDRDVLGLHSEAPIIT
jgi:hypothetical protein